MCKIIALTLLFISLHAASIENHHMGAGGSSTQDNTEIIHTLGGFGSITLQDNSYLASSFIGQVSNAAPTLIDLNALNAPSNEPTSIIFTAADADGDVILYTIVTGPLSGTLTGTGPLFLYTPNTDYTGEDSFQIAVHDGADSSEVLTMSLTVRLRRKILVWVQPDDATLQFIEIEEIAQQAAYVVGVGSLFPDLDQTLDCTFTWVFGGAN